MVSADVHEENPSQANIQSEKGGIWGDDFLLWYHTHTQPVVVSWRSVGTVVWTCPVNFSCSVTLKSIGVPWALNGSLTHTQFCHILCWSFKNHASPSTSSNCQHLWLNANSPASPWPHQRRLSVCRRSGTHGGRGSFSTMILFARNRECHSWQQKLFVIFHKITRFICEKNSGQTTPSILLSNESSVPCKQLSFAP